MQTRHPPAQSPLYKLLLAALPWDDYEQLLRTLQRSVLELGHASRPIGDAELRIKFLACTAIALDPSAASRWGDAALAPPQAPVRWP